MNMPKHCKKSPSLLGDKKLKIWVPETVFEALTLTASDRQIARPELIRRLLFAHVFGRDALDEVVAATSIGYEDDIRFSRRSEVYYSLPDRSSSRDESEAILPLGKSIADALVLVSEDIRDGLRRLAEHHKQPLGTYAAYVLCWAMFGRGVYSRLALKVNQGMWVGEKHDEPAKRETES